MSRASPFRAAQQFAVKTARSGEVIDRESKVEGQLGHNGGLNLQGITHN
jgi:hypothetical protein